MTSRGLVAFVLAAAAILFPACQERRAKPRVVRSSALQPLGSTAIDSPAMSYLPRRDEIPGWVLQQDPLVYPREQVNAYLDGDAKNFFAYGLIDLTVGRYASADGQNYATVEILRFPDFVKAFGAYSVRRQVVLGYAPVENEAFLGPHSLHLWRGPFYVRITMAGSNLNEAALLQLAKGVADRMPKAPGKPAIFSFFPTTSRLPNSDAYTAQPALGQPFFTYAFTTQFNVGGQLIDGIIVPARDRNGAARILDQYRRFFVTNGRLLDNIPNLGEENFTAEDKFVGRTAALRLDRFVVVFRGYGDRQTLVDLAGATDQRILGTIRRELTAADEAVQNPPAQAAPPANAPPWAQPQPPRQQQQ